MPAGRRRREEILPSCYRCHLLREMKEGWKDEVNMREKPMRGKCGEENGGKKKKKRVEKTREESQREILKDEKRHVQYAERGGSILNIRKEE